MVVGADKSCSCGGGDVRGQMSTFGDDDVVPEPDIVAEDHFSIGIGTRARGIGKGMLVGVHEGAIPRDARVIAKGHGLMTDQGRARPETKHRSQGQYSIFCHFDGGAHTYGAVAFDDHITLYADTGPMIAEVAVGTAVESYFDESCLELWALYFDMAGEVADDGVMGE